MSKHRGIKRALKGIAETMAPGTFAEWQARRSRIHSERLEAEWGCSALSKKFVAEQGPKVLRGPLQGVVFVPETHHRHITPKLLGAYEEELHPVLEDLLRISYDTIVDVGAADGAYAIGFARRQPAAHVFAFDTDSWSRHVVQLMKQRNRVSNLSVHGACTPEQLQDILKPAMRSFLLSDCEGFENLLLDPQKVPALTRCNLVVELHEQPAPGVTERLNLRFQDTHRLSLISSRESDPSSFPEISSLSRADQYLAVSDLRFQPQQWLVAHPR